MRAFCRCGDRPALIGVIHLLPLPGAPVTGPDLEVVLERARADARALVDGGADGCIVENYGDAPFAAEQVPPVTVAAMTRAVLAVRELAPDLLLGVNVLRNDASAALGVATVTEAEFVRINVHTGVMLTDQGLLTGRARQTAFERRMFQSSVRLAADVLVKHAVPLGPVSLRQVARDTAYRGLADALIVTGAGTGLPLDPSDVATVGEAVPEAPVWAGSGVTPERVPTGIDAAVVGTWLHRDADTRAPLEVERVRAMRSALG